MRIALILLTLTLGVGLAPPAVWAGSIAYIDNGEVWIASLDGAQKVRIASPAVVNGKTEKYNAVAAADNGRIVASRNEPGKISSLSWFKAWEPNGSSTVEGPLNPRPGWTSIAYPLGFDLTPDGGTMIYGYSASNCCFTFGQGTYVRPVTNSAIEPINISGQEDPSLFGTRVIAHSGTTIYAQDPGTPYGDDFQPWLSIAASGLELHRTDVAASGQVAAFEGEQWDNGTKIVGRIGVVSIQGVDQGPTGAVDCYVQASGVATDVSLSQDGRQIAWTDAQGLKVAATPTGIDEFCVFSSAPIVISPTGTSASIGGANVAAFLPPAPPVSPPVPPTPTPPATAPVGTTAPIATVPSKVTTKALAAGLPVKLTLSSAGKVTLSATVPAKALGRKGKPVVVATGSGTAKAAGKLTVKLRLNSVGKKKLKRLKGVKLTLRIVQGGRTTTKTVTLR
jgi:uncharacterized Zn-binding protein involved in type VI secretion